MRRVLVVLTFALTWPLQAQVAGASRPIRLVVSGGLQLPTGSFADAHDMGVHADVSVIIAALGIRLRPEMSYTRFSLKDAFALPSALGQAGAGGAGGGRRDVTGDALSTLLGGFANIELPLGSGAFQPFLLGGLGAVSLKSDATTAAEAFSEVKASVNLGAGIRFRLGGIGGLIEARMNNVPSGDLRTYFKDVRTIPVTFGLVF